MDAFEREIAEPVIKRHQLDRTIDYLMMGSRHPGEYPLRVKMYEKMKDVEGTVIHDHPGYKNFSAKDAEKKFLNEYYAMEISRSRIFLTCGSRYNYPLGKYFEVPACKSLLLATGFPELEELGFIDKETFVEIN